MTTTVYIFKYTPQIGQIAHVPAISYAKFPIFS